MQNGHVMEANLRVVPSARNESAVVRPHHGLHRVIPLDKHAKQPVRENRTHADETISRPSQNGGLVPLEHALHASGVARVPIGNVQPAPPRPKVEHARHAPHDDLLAVADGLQAQHVVVLLVRDFLLDHPAQSRLELVNAKRSVPAGGNKRRLVLVVNNVRNVVLLLAQRGKHRLGAGANVVDSDEAVLQAPCVHLFGDPRPAEPAGLHPVGLRRFSRPARHHRLGVHQAEQARAVPDQEVGAFCIEARQAAGRQPAGGLEHGAPALGATALMGFVVPELSIAVHQRGRRERARGVHGHVHCGHAA
mmetsp:Transcript_2240/g.6867  ORF Transcript_2240/g.6867 Transcript_2240/m.6867 type:complete len:306 (+) Transcript_2240:467-1384(+)